MDPRDDQALQRQELDMSRWVCSSVLLLPSSGHDQLTNVGQHRVENKGASDHTRLSQISDLVLPVVLHPVRLTTQPSFHPLINFITGGM